MEILIKECCMVNGESVKAGEIVETSDKTARLLISIGRAEAFTGQMIMQPLKEITVVLPAEIKAEFEAIKEHEKAQQIEPHKNKRKGKHK